jgi:hypothetical protein
MFLFQPQAVDVWSFGIVLYELWALREPYDGLNYHALLHMMSSSKEAVRPALPGKPIQMINTPHSDA